MIKLFTLCRSYLAMAIRTNKVRQKKTWLMAGFSAAIGCSTVQVNDSLRTTSKAFDGRWVGTISSPAEIQYAGFDSISCDAIETTIWINVTDGILSADLYLDDNLSFTANVNDGGRFYAEIPKQSSYQVNGRSRFGAYEYHVFHGVLLPWEGVTVGYYRDAIGQMGSGGCKYQIVFKRQRT